MKGWLEIGSYQNKDLSQLRYNIFSQSLSGGFLGNEPVPKLQI